MATVDTERAHPFAKDAKGWAPALSLLRGCFWVALCGVDGIIATPHVSQGTSLGWPMREGAKDLPLRSFRERGAPSVNIQRFVDGPSKDRW